MQMTADTRYLIFAYGSLMHKPSARISVGRDIELFPAYLNGWQRIWNATTDNSCSGTYCCPECLGVVDSYIAVTNIIPMKDAFVPGAYFEVDRDELLALQDREKRYDCLGVVSEQFNFFDNCPDARSLFVWSRKAQFCYQPGQRPCIPSDYLSSCLYGSLALYGRNGGELFTESTIKPEPFNIIPALRLPNSGQECCCSNA